eukprot:jgi/Bigna1/137667/aug1.40_g12375
MVMWGGSALTIDNCPYKLLGKTHICRWVLSAARELKMPVIATEQYPKALGSTVKEVKAELEVVETVKKQENVDTWAGAVVTTTESAIFELLGDFKHPLAKKLSKGGKGRPECGLPQGLPQASGKL